MLHLLTLAASLSPFEWVSTHMQLVGWPSLVFAAWWVGRQFQEVKTQIVKTVTQIDQMATNHFPHMEGSLANQDKILESQTVLLTNMDRNIARLADRY